MASTDASLACQAIGESLWSPTSADFLPYLAYQNMSGLYHVADGACANLSSSGLDNVVQSCADAHPVVCTNSAPLANSTSSNNGTEWQIKVNAPSDTDDASSAAYIGYRTKDVFVFQGIPYANPFDRWTYSTVSNQTGDIPALTYQSQCTQAGNVGSEDCLYLNIWTPTLPMTNTTDRSSLKAVMFQIHGGAYTGGTGADPGLAGANLASRGDVVVVTINYRLTTLGFLALDDGATNGNYGIGDQITALQWVRQNIAAFGGDPDRVTIFGQSAGAGSVRALLGSPRAMGLYSAAIMESNLAGWAYADTYSQYYTIQQEVAVAANPILNATNCTDAASRIDCLRQVDAHLLANLSTVARYVVQDGNIITDSTLAVTGNGPAAHVPVMIGFMRDDGASFVSYPNAKNYPGTAGVPDNFTGVLIPAGFPAELTVQAADLYPIQQGTNQSLQLYNATSQAATDAEFRCLDEASAYSAVLHNVWPKACVVFSRCMRV
jgi:carboxylesterase type B